MDTQAEILNFLHLHKQFLKENFQLSKIALFGSFARGDASKDSDIDILIELKKDAKNIYDLKSELKEYLSKHFDRKVDIAREKYLKPYAKDIILKDALYV